MIFSTGPLTEVGRVIKTHGYEGKLRFELFNGIEIDSKEPVFMMFDHKPVPFFLLEISKSNPHIVKLQDVDTLEQAQLFLSKSLYLPAIETVDEEEDSFVGFEVIDTTIGPLGTIKEIMENAAQDIILVEYQGRDLLIPFVEELIESIDESKRTILFNLPEGLITLE